MLLWYTVGYFPKEMQGTLSPFYSRQRQVKLYKVSYKTNIDECC